MIDASVRDSWQALADRLGAFIARRVPAQDVDDLLQDVLLRIHRHAPELNDDSRFGPWVYSIARNSVIDWHRKRATSRIDAADHPEPAAAVEFEHESPLVDCVAPFVARLPSPYREALTLVELQEMTQAEAADVEGISLSGMKSRVQRGRRLMREMFEDCCVLTLDVRGRVRDAERRDAGACADSCGSCGDPEKSVDRDAL